MSNLKTTDNAKEARTELVNYLDNWAKSSPSNLQAVKKAYNDAQKEGNGNTTKKSNNDKYDTGPVRQ